MLVVVNIPEGLLMAAVGRNISAQFLVLTFSLLEFLISVAITTSPENVN